MPELEELTEERGLYAVSSAKRLYFQSLPVVPKRSVGPIRFGSAERHPVQMNWFEKWSRREPRRPRTEQDAYAAIDLDVDEVATLVLKICSKLRGKPTSSDILRALPDALAEVRGSKERRASRETFLDRADRLSKSEHLDPALDLIYDCVDDLMRQDAFERLDTILATCNADVLSTDVLLGMLTATLPAKSRLPSRARLFREVQRVLKERGEDEEGLLVGLEG